MRYGYNWFVRGTDSNPDNHGFDLTSLGFPASYHAAIPDDIRRFPRFNITGYQGTAIGGEERPNETHSFMATLNKTAGAHSMKSGLEFRRYREPNRFFANNQTGQFDFDSTWTRGPLDNSAVAPGFARPVVRLLPARHSERGVGRPGGQLRRVVHDVGLLRAGRLESRFAPHRQPGPPVRARGAADRDGQSQRPRLRRERRAADRGGGAERRTRSIPTPEVPASQFNVRGGLTFPGVDGEPRRPVRRRRRTTSCRDSAWPTAWTTRPRCGRATGCSTASSASAAGT